MNQCFFVPIITFLHEQHQEQHLICKEIIPKRSLLGNADHTGVTSE